MSLLAIGLCACGGSGSSGGTSAATKTPAGDDTGFRLRYALPASDKLEEGAVREALDKSLPILRKRVEDLGVAHASIVRVDKEIVVELAGGNELSAAELREVLPPAGALEVRLVHREGDFMQRLCASLKSDSKAGVMRIETGLDIWQDGSGATVKQCYLAASDRVAMLNREEAAAENCPSRGDAERTRCVVSGQTLLQRYLSGRTDIQIAPEYELAFESSESSGIGGEIGERYWRSHYLQREAIADSGSIVSASIETLPDQEHEQLLIAFGEPGKSKLEELFATGKGNKLAILVDGRVEHALVIREELVDGLLRAELGPTSTPASVLVPLLRGGPLPHSLVEVSAEAY